MKTPKKPRTTKHRTQRMTKKEGKKHLKVVASSASFMLADLEIPGAIPDIEALVLEFEAGTQFLNFFKDIPEF